MPDSMCFSIRFSIRCLTLASVLCTTSLASEDLRRTLLDKGVAPARFLGDDARGIPRLCGATDTGADSVSKRRGLRKGLPSLARSHETIPSAIRTDGMDTFRVEVDVNVQSNGGVTRVTMETLGNFGLVPPEELPFGLRDDGAGEDRIAGDGVYTTGLYRWDPDGFTFPSYRNDPASPSGVDIIDVGVLNIEEADGTITEFLLPPCVGIVNASIPEVTTTRLTDAIVVSPHLVNIRTTERETQTALRGLGGNLRDLARPIYTVLTRPHKRDHPLT